MIKYQTKKKGRFLINVPISQAVKTIAATEDPHYRDCLKDSFNFVDKLFAAIWYEYLMSILTIVVLFIGDIRVLAWGKNGDDAYYYFMLVCFLIFATELVILSIVRTQYFLGFYFWMDLASTLSMAIEVPLLLELVGLDTFITGQQAKLARLGRASRVSTRVTKLIRIIRIIRLSRIAKLYKYAAKQVKITMKKDKSLKARKADDQALRLNIVASTSPEKYNDISSPTKTIGKYNSLQKMELKEPNWFYIKLWSINNRIGKVYYFHIFSLEYNHHNQVESLRRKSSVRNLQANKKFNDRKSVQFPNFTLKDKASSSSSSSEDSQSSDSGSELENFPAKFQQETKETKIGRRLQELTTQRAIMLMFSIIISIPFFDYDTYWPSSNSWQNGLNAIEIQYPPYFDTLAIKSYVSHHTLEEFPILYLQINDTVALNDFDVDNSRQEEYEQFFSYSGNTTVVISRKYVYEIDGILSMLRTVFLIALLVVASMLFAEDTQVLVVTPIEEMCRKVKQIGANPLEAAKIAEEEELIEANSKQLKKKIVDETIILQQLIVKTGALLALGFGEAGSKIIAKSMSTDGEVQSIIPGERVVAIFGFCDIRNFTDTTEVLQQEVLKFVNEIAAIVHSTVMSFEGFPNKNIGDAFLVIWKFEENLLELQADNNIVVKDSRMVGNIADMSIISFAKIQAKIRKSASLIRISKNEKLQSRMPNYEVRLGVGMHAGWAIEGPIGSAFKIDVSYLSPNVNITGWLEELTKNYGCSMLISGQLYSLTSAQAKKRIRHIDRVMPNEGSDVLDLYSFDINLSRILQQDAIRTNNGNQKVYRYYQRRRQQERYQKIKSNKYNAFSLFETDTDIKTMTAQFTEDFQALYHQGLNHYLQGRWRRAKIFFENAQVFFENIPFFFFLKQLLGNYNDGASNNMILYIQKHNCRAPRKWLGYRQLFESEK